MDGLVSKPQVTPLFSNEVLGRLEHMRLRSIRRFTDRMRGEHLAGRAGSSNEFSDFRDYVPGDDVRFVDWNVFARLNRPYLKLYRREEEMHVVLMVDASTSMLFEGKIERAKQLAAAFAVMGLLGTEKVSATAFTGTGVAPARLTPCMGRASLMKSLAFIEGIEAGGSAPVDESIELFLRAHVGRGIAVVLSDFLTFGDLALTFNRLTGAGLEIFAVQILAPSELEPEVGGDLRLVDSETAETLDVSPGELIDIYREYRENFQRELARLCRQRAGRFVSISASDALPDVLFDLLPRKGWVR